MSYSSHESAASSPFFITDVILEAALLVFLISSCFIRRPRHEPNAIPFKTLLVSLLSYIILSCLQALNPWGIISTRGAANVVWTIDSYLPQLLSAIVLYRLLEAYNLQRHERRTKSFPVLNTHGSILVVLFIIKFIWTIMVIVYIFRFEGDGVSFAYSINYIQLALAILFLICSIEIMVEISMVIWKQKDSRRSCKGIMSFIVGGFFFIVINVCSLIDPLQLVFDRLYDWSFGLLLSFHIAYVVGVIGFYTAIIHCCMQWHKSRVPSPEKPVRTNETEYGITASEDRLS